VLPSNAALARMTTRQRIVAIAESQVEYRTTPVSSYCNKYSYYWGDGAVRCGNGERSEKWCADFAAWVWRHAGIRFPFGYAYGDINASAASFYSWGVDHGTWHAASSAYSPLSGDLALYGLTLEPTLWAAHVAVVIGLGSQGPVVVNGDGDRTGFSVIEVGRDQSRISVGNASYPLAGYVTP
jgi:hypothetical protein